MSLDNYDNGLFRRGSRLGRNPEKFVIVGALIGSVFFFLFLYLINLQLFRSNQFDAMAKRISLRTDLLQAQRGRIFDRNHDIPMAVNIDSFGINIVPAEIHGITHNELFTKVAELLDIPLEDIQKKIPPRNYRLYQAVEIMNGVPYEKIVHISEHYEDYPGVYWESRTLRNYNLTGSISHVMGYVGSITSEELQVMYNKGYSYNSVIGKIGIEKQYDMLLRGNDGKVFKTVDAKGRRLGKEEIEPPTNGFDLVLTIDRDLQILAEKALGPRKGSVVVLKPATGEVLALVSYPYYDPNKFNEPGPQSFKDLSVRKDFPFLNRAIQSVYPPASAFKIIMTIAQLESGLFPSDKSITCRGRMMVGNREFNCHKRYGHGPLDLKHALAQSCNIYYGTVGLEYLGIDVISEYAKILGLGEVTGIDLGEEISGVVPTASWKKSTYNSVWTGGDTINASIGQGFLAVSPIQMANVVAAVVNDGVVYKPHLLKEVVDPSNGEPVQKTEPEILRETYLSSDTCRITREAMRMVVSEGTAKVVILNTATKVAGKTGTGEIGAQEQWHSWFVSFAPYETDNPEERIIVVVMVEAGETWEWWAPKAADIIYQGYFGNMTFEEILESYKKRWVWYSPEIRPIGEQ